MTIPRLPFGRTGHASSRVIFGGAALGGVTQDVADRALEVLLQHDVNHIDVAASYGDAELRVRPWLQRHQGRFFVATKTGERRAGPAREQLHRSLDRLGVDHVDLWQLHNLVDPIEWDTALSPGGALEAALEARELTWVGPRLCRAIVMPSRWSTVSAPILPVSQGARSTRSRCSPPSGAAGTAAAARRPASPWMKSRRSTSSSSGTGPASSSSTMPSCSAGTSKSRQSRRT